MRPARRAIRRKTGQAVTAYLPAPGTNTGAGIVILPGGGFTRRCADHEGVLAAEWLARPGGRRLHSPVSCGAHRNAEGCAPGRPPRDAVRPRPCPGMGRLAPSSRGNGLLRRRNTGRQRRSSLAARPAGRRRPRGARDEPSGLPGARLWRREPGQPRRAAAGRGASAPRGAAQILLSHRGRAGGRPSGIPVLHHRGRGTGPRHGRPLRAARPGEPPGGGPLLRLGEHGVGFALGDPLLGQWPSLLLSWMRTSGLLTEQPRVALRGSVKVDGASPCRADRSSSPRCKAPPLPR